MLQQIGNEFAVKLSDRCRDLSLVGFGFITWSNVGDVSNVQIPYVYCLWFLAALLLDVTFWLSGTLFWNLLNQPMRNKKSWSNILGAMYTSKIVCAGMGWLLSFVFVLKELINNAGT